MVMVISHLYVHTRDSKHILDRLLLLGENCFQRKMDSGTDVSMEVPAQPGLHGCTSVSLLSTSYNQQLTLCKARR